ncbi:hypothetical protein [Salinibacillus xinjiangensis]|uniref:Uncharacterized protein n=1 Tax=Salinibacillus xinjiangensis TaxID=1229268 RepID=A0A6G1X665_9BACI|nr:hypothetical protein [Salinibacillus xinjiangensis]MRG86396.1 hypothetical protein [Salinibacillus xinjiangensis]
MKAYFFKRMPVWIENDWEQKDIVFTKEKFVPKHYVNQLPKRQIHANIFQMTPGNVYVDNEFPLSSKALRDHHVRRYLYQGCSLLLSSIDLERTYNWKDLFQEYKQELAGIAIDHIVVPKINLKYLTAEMVRYFALQRTPFILVYTSEDLDLDHVKWGWLNQMQSISQIPLACLEHPNSTTLFKFMHKHSLHTLPEIISVHPLSKESLTLTGISPKKGELQIYGDADFNLHVPSNRGNINLQNPYISIIRGNVVKLNQTVYDQKGFGQYFEIMNKP